MLKPSIVATVGKVVDQLEVTIGPQFLNLFSEHLYSSANKAFEELVSNSWDADADVVYIHVPKDLSVQNAAVWVLENGSSMDVAGLRELWHVANSPKRVSPVLTKRPQIGKFGIGKRHNPKQARMRGAIIDRAVRFVGCRGKRRNGFSASNSKRDTWSRSPEDTLRPARCHDRGGW